jgi:hypothetical protein
MISVANSNDYHLNHKLNTSLLTLSIALPISTHQFVIEPVLSVVFIVMGSAFSYFHMDFPMTRKLSMKAEFASGNNQDNSSEHSVYSVQMLSKCNKKGFLESFKLAIKECHEEVDNLKPIDHQPVLINTMFTTPNMSAAPSMHRRVSSVSIVVGDHHHRGRSFDIRTESYNHLPIHPTAPSRSVSKIEAHLLLKLKSSVEKHKYSGEGHHWDEMDHGHGGIQGGFEFVPVDFVKTAVPVPDIIEEDGIEEIKI